MATYIFASNGAIRHNEMNTNFADVESLAKAIGNSQISGGITADKLTDRYSPDINTVVVVPDSYGQTLGATGAANCWNPPAAMTSIKKFKPVLKDGYESFLVAAIVYVRETLQNGASGPGYANMAIYRNTDIIGGGAFDLDVSDAYYVRANEDPLASPISSFANGDYLDIQMGTNATAGTPRIRGVDVTFVWKHVLLP